MIEYVAPEYYIEYDVVIVLYILLHNKYMNYKYSSHMPLINIFTCL